MEFVGFLAFNYLIGAPDSHSKNFSILHVGPDVRLAPMYDVASTLPYEGFENARFAFSIGGQRVFGSLSDALADPALPPNELSVRMLPAVARLCASAL